MLKKIVFFIMIFIFSESLLHAEVLIGKDQYLYVPKSDNRRLLLEPGSVLLRKAVPKDQIYKKRIRVISAGGIEGEVKSRDIDSINDMNTNLAYVKDEINIKGNKYPIGTVFPVEIIDDEDEILYEITYVKPSYSVKQNGFVMKEKKIQYLEENFLDSFNIIDPEEVNNYKFPFWKKDLKNKPTEWGCGESKEIVSNLGTSIDASVEANGGFFSFFSVKTEIGAEHASSTVYKKVLKDDAYKHRITYWTLVDANNSSKSLLNVALEKISICDTNRGVDNSYIIRFEKKHNLDEIKINAAWVKSKGFKKGGGSPLRIDSQSDLHKFENALKDFKFTHTKDGFDLKRAIIDFSIMLTVNLNYSAK